MSRIPFCLLAFVTVAANAASSALPVRPDNFNLNAFKGKVVYLDFWASWCGPCKLSFPYMEQLAHSFDNRELVVIADNLDHSTAKAQAFLRSLGATIPVMYDRKGVLATRFNVSTMPTSILIDRDGKIRYVHKGFFENKESEYTSHVIELINEKN